MGWDARGTASGRGSRRKGLPEFARIDPPKLGNVGHKPAKDGVQVLESALKLTIWCW